MESWPVTTPELELDRADVARHLGRVRVLMERHDIDALVITSSDRFLNEYTPRADNHRFLLSGFTGSTALLLVPMTGSARLYVDGRYYLQADLEVEPTLIDVVKVPFGKSISALLLEDLRGRRRVGCEGDRLSESFRESIAKSAGDLILLESGAVDAVFDHRCPLPEKALVAVPAGVSGRDLEAKLDAVFARIEDAARTLLLVPALDDIAWLTDVRGYHFLYQSSFAALGLARSDRLRVLVDRAVFDKGLPVRARLEWTHDALDAALASPDFDDVEVLSFDPEQTTAAVLESIRRGRPAWTLRPNKSPVVGVKAIKTAAEIAHFEDINVRSSRAVAKTIRWVRSTLASGDRVSEATFYDAANGFYAAEGARDLSFHTISAIGANTAVIHFSSPSDDVVATPDDLMLLDSGALYEGGFATDITRTFLAGGSSGRPTDRHRRIYTAALAGLLNAQSARFPDGTRGAFLDHLARAPIWNHGLDYAHGTGHGVGIHVHEPGVGLSPTSALPILAGQISSIEPGVYIPGFGGVRHENVVVFENDGDYEGFLRARPLVYVGFDEALIDRSMLTESIAAVLDAYQAECRRRDTDI